LDGRKERPEPGPRKLAAAPPSELACDVAIGCAYCKGKLARPEAVYCAACLAPQHGDCWREHGACAACRGTAFVRAQLPTRRVFPRRLLGLGLAGLGAALVAFLLHTPEKAAPPPRAPVAVPVRAPVTPVTLTPPDPDTCTGAITDIVDLSRPPHAVEGQNKIRVGVIPTVDPATGSLTIDVQGVAYYPDGVQVMLGLRHWKSDTFFARTKVTVKDRTIGHTFGPFTKTIPGGGLVVEARFYLSDQKPAIQASLQEEHYFHCTPPCDRDKRNRTEVSWQNRGPAAQAASVAEEKDAIERARSALAAARTAANARLDAAAGAASPVDEARAALDRLEADAGGAVDAYLAWAKTREFLLFPARRPQLVLLEERIVSAAKARSVLRGVPIAGLEREKAATLAAGDAKEATSVLEDLALFHAEADSLERMR
jgi:hypothetical protein